MAEKFKKIVRTPEQAAKKIRQGLEDFKPLQKSREKQRKRDADGRHLRHPDAADAVKTGALGALKLSGWLAAGGAQFLFWLLRSATLDNAVIEKMENNFRNMDMSEKFKRDKKTGKTKLSGPGATRKFANKHPAASAYLTWYFALATLIGGGMTGVRFGPDVAHSVKEWRMERQKQREIQDAAEKNAGTFAAYMDKMRPLTPLLVAELLTSEGVCIDQKTGMHVVYDDYNGRPLAPGQKPRGKATIGFGSTVLPDGTSVNSYTKPITTREAYEMSVHHIEQLETYFMMYCYETGCENIKIDSDAEAVAMASIIYNSGANLLENPKSSACNRRFGELRKLYDEYGYALPDSLVRQTFEKYPVSDPMTFGKLWIEGAADKKAADKLGLYVKQGRGLYTRRMIEAGIMTGQILPEVLLDVPVNGMSEFLKLMGGKKHAFFVGTGDNICLAPDVVDKFNQWVKNPVDKRGNPLSGARWPRVRDVLPDEVVALCDGGSCRLGNTDFIIAAPIEKEIKQETYVSDYRELYADATQLYRGGNYADAARGFEELLQQRPDNAQLHNDLAATYNQMGRYDDAIGHVREIVWRIGDKCQYGAAQYNAGFAYEQKGELQKALANYKLAVANGNRRVAADIKRVSEKINKSKSKKTAWADGMKNIENRAYSTDFSFYEMQAGNGKA